MNERTLRAVALPASRQEQPAAATKASRSPRLPGGSLLAVPAGLFVLFVAVPLLALLYRAAQSGQLWTSLQQPVIRDALRISLTTSLMTVALVVVFGTPLAYLLARYRFPGRQLIDTLIDLPMVLPPVVAGVALLMAFGRRGVFGDAMAGAGINIAFTAKAVVAAQVFVSSPFYIRAVRVGFQSVDPTLEEAASIDGAGAMAAFRYITLPLTMPSFVSGIVLCWARALSEFGGTMMFAGNLRGTTQTMSLAIMSAMETNLYTALAMAVILAVIAFAVLLVFRGLTREAQGF